MIRLFSVLALLASTSAFAANLTLATKGDEMAYDKNKFTVKAGEDVKLTFNNKAKPSSGMQHNFVLTVIGADQNKVAMAGIQAGPDKGYVPATTDVIVATKLLQPGQSETLSFKAPTVPGDYPFLCTFPGHAMMMKGTFTVKK